MIWKSGSLVIQFDASGNKIINYTWMLQLSPIIIKVSIALLSQQHLAIIILTLQLDLI